MTVTFNRNYGTGNTSLMSQVIMPFMIFIMAGIAIWSYAYATLLYTGIMHLVPQGTSPLTPVEQFTTGAHVSAAGLFALLAISNEEKHGRITLKAVAYFALTLTLFGIFFYTLFTAG